MMNCFMFQPDGTTKCSVAAYLQSGIPASNRKGKRMPAVVICPGGSYEYVSEREGDPVAKEYIAAGYHVFVLHYSVKAEAANFQPLCQLAATMAHIRKHAEEWLVEENKIAVCGFSAGGHLAASLGALFNEEAFQNAWNRTEDIRPNAMILGYPVILANEYAHVNSIENVSGNQAGTEEYEWFGLDKHVDVMTPPAFLWHTVADSIVPVENSLYFAAALSAAKVPYELHIFPEGDHAMSVCSEEVGTADSYNGRWVEWSIQWLNVLFSFTK